MRELKRDLWPVKVTIQHPTEHSVTDMEVWMGKQFGTFKGRWNFVWNYNKLDVYFRNEQDATMFSLRWA